MNSMMVSNIRIEVRSETGFTYAMDLPFGAPYEEAFIALEELKKNVERMQEAARERAEEAKKEQNGEEPKGE